MVKLILALALFAGTAAELTFTAYTEGTRFHKAVVVSNDGCTDVQLNDYTISMYMNGYSGTSNSNRYQSLTLTDVIIPPGGSYTLCNRKSGNQPGRHQSDFIDGCDFFTTGGRNGGLQHNGDDTIVLQKNGATIDTIGEIGSLTKCRKSVNANLNKCKNQACVRTTAGAWGSSAWTCGYPKNDAPEELSAFVGVSPICTTPTSAACSVTCITGADDLLKVTHDTSSAHAHHRCYVDYSASGDPCLCECSNDKIHWVSALGVDCVGAWSADTCNPACNDDCTPTLTYTYSTNQAGTGDVCDHADGETMLGTLRDGITCPVDCIGAWSADTCTAPCDDHCTPTLTYTYSTNQAGTGDVCDHADGETMLGTLRNGDACPVDCVGAWSADTCTAPCDDHCTPTLTYTYSTNQAGTGDACDHADGETMLGTLRNGDACPVVGCTGSSCSCTMQQGDGTGGSEEYLGHASSHSDCAAMVQSQRPTANGATLSAAGSGSCYAEFGMNGDNDSGAWISCQFENAPASTCVFQQGDGTGGYEEYLGHASTEAQCHAMVTAQRPSANGATVSPGGGSCYAEFGMNGDNNSGSWRTCQFMTGNLGCTMQQGDGTGGSEEYLGHASSHTGCAAMVQSQRPTANGATLSAAGSGSCYAEFGMNGDNDSGSWISCQFENGAPGSTCVFQQGDGTGGSEEYLGQASTEAQCHAMVTAQRPSANGATVSPNGGSCYAEFGMNGDNNSGWWRTCQFIH